MKQIIGSEYKWYFFAGLLGFVLTAVFSVGYHHPDEHFQILEFCNYKLGNTPAIDLPWEFHGRIRSALQPVITLLTIKIMNVLGVTSPFTYTLILRCFTVVLAWWCMCKIILLWMDNVQSEAGKRIYILLHFFLWFMPYISVRYSSENYASITFMAAIYFLSVWLKRHSANYLLLATGFLLAVSFYFRFQMGFAILGLGCWLLVRYTLRLQEWIILLGSGCMGLLLGVAVDYWFYGSLVWTPYNYFVANIIDHKAAGFGVAPWWSYLEYFIVQGIPPLSLILLYGFVRGLWLKRMEPIVWCLGLFILGHMVVGHKEMRFLYPIAFAFIYLVAIGIDQLIRYNLYRRWWSGVLTVVLAINKPLYLFRMFAPAQDAVSYYQFLYHYTRDRPLVLYCKAAPLYQLADLQTSFYKAPNLKTVVVKDDQALQTLLTIERPDSMYLLERDLTAHDYPGYRVTPVYSILPEWIYAFNYNDWVGRSMIWNIVKLHKTN